jgi:hypothetical protein
VPIGVDLPNPVLPFILPSIHIDITHVSLPANVVAAVVNTFIFDAAGVGPLVRGLEDTAASLRASRAALQTVREAISAGGAARMREAMERSQPTAPLSVEVVGPRPGSVAASRGEFVFRIPGATWAMVDPRGEGLPAEAISRIQVLVNGRVVPLGSIQWWNYGVAMEGHLQYAVQDALPGDPSWPSVTVPPGPVAVVVLVTDGTGAASAQAAWHVIVQDEQRLVLAAPPAWFPIAYTATFRASSGTPLIVMTPIEAIPRRDRHGQVPSRRSRPEPGG